MRAAVGLIAGVTLTLTTQGAYGQPLYTLKSPNPAFGGYFGCSVSGAGDVDADGYDDFVVGTGENRAYVFSGDGAVLVHTLTATDPAVRYFGAYVSGAGDVDNGGHDDVVVGKTGGFDNPYDPVPYGMATAFSGENWGELYTWHSGDVSQSPTLHSPPVAAAGDVNSDGFDDVIVGTLFTEHACVYSGDGGDCLLTLTSPSPEAGSFGRSVSGLGDINGDGCSDVVVGAYREDGGASDAGRAYVFSGSDGSLVHALVSGCPETYGYFGYSVSGAADVNGDGCSDIIVGAHKEDGGAPDAGRAYVFSGSEGTLLYTLLSPYPDGWGRLGCSVSGTGDVNGDGVGDLVIGACGEDGGAVHAGRAYIFSGNDGGVLHVLRSSYPKSTGYFGGSVSDGGDMNGDGRSEVVVGAPREDGGATYAGRVYVFSGMDVPIELSSFGAETRDGRVLLLWTTQTEQDNYGFHLYRAAGEPVGYLRITADIIPGAGTSTVPHHYSHTDRDVGSGLTYFYKLADVDVRGNQTLHGPVSVTMTPVEFALLGNQPNPFSQATSIRLSLAAPGHVRISIYNSAGDLVRILSDGPMEPGTQEIRWDGCDEAGTQVPPGAYTCRLQAGDSEQSRSVVLIR
jgi:hypothetical protein